MRLTLLLLIVIGAAAVAVPVDEYLPSLEGANVFRLNAETDEQLAKILAYQERNGHEILRYSHVLGDDIQIFVTAENVEDFKEFLVKQDISSTIDTENVQEAVDEEGKRQERGRFTRSTGRISFTVYPRYDTIVEFLKQIAEDRSDIATLIYLGNSTENREIYGLKISSGGSAGKPAVLVEGTYHAREWICPTTVNYFINEFIENPSSSALFSKVDWYFFPVLNPDGYEFSHTTYRLQRKTRNQNPGSSCFGTDPNRNFGHYWMETGASLNPCSDTFAGSGPFSEPETQIFRDFVLEHSNEIKLHLSYHSWGNYFIYPWGYVRSTPDNVDELQTLGEAANEAQYAFRGTNYTVGPVAIVLYPNAGNSIDWATGAAGIDLAFVIELPGGGIFNFDIPASQILPVAQESFLALRVFGEHVATKYGS